MTAIATEPRRVDRVFSFAFAVDALEFHKFSLAEVQQRDIGVARHYTNPICVVAHALRRDVTDRTACGIGSRGATTCNSLGRFDMSAANVKLAPGRCISQEVGRARGFPIERRHAETEINRGCCGLGFRGDCHRSVALGRCMFGAEPGATPNARDTRLSLAVRLLYAVAPRLRNRRSSRLVLSFHPSIVVAPVFSPTALFVWMVNEIAWLATNALTAKTPSGQAGWRQNGELLIIRVIQA